MPSFHKILFLAVSLSLLNGCGKRDASLDQPEAFLPSDTEAVLKIEQWEQTREDISDHPVFSKLKQEPFGVFFKKYGELSKNLLPKGTLLLAVGKADDSITNFTLVAKSRHLGFLPDSIPNLKIDSSYTKSPLKKYQIGTEVFYTAVLDSIGILSTSDAVLENIITGKTLKDEGFLTALKVKQNKPLSFTTYLNLAAKTDSLLPWGSYSSFELQLVGDGVIAHGVVMDQDSLGERLSVFRGQLPQKTNTPSITLGSAKRAVSFAFSNADSLSKRLIGTKMNRELHPIFETTNEMSWVKTATSSYVGLHSLDTDLSWESLSTQLTEMDTYRDITLYRLSEATNLFQSFSEYVDLDFYGVAFSWEDSLLFTTSEEQAKELISGLLNKSVLSATSNYQNATTYLAQSASLVIYEMDGIWEGLPAALLDTPSSRLKGFPLLVTQLIYDRDFAHLNLVAKAGTSETISSGPIQQLASIRLDADLMGPPKFFTNHNTGGKDIVAQDLSNQLYLISTNGKILWKKKLDGPILGPIHEVDLLRNGKKQMAFTTRNTFYILDRNGNGVAPFPKKFNDPITQPVSVFDYDNNRKYRFVIVQKDRLYMYDSKGETVKGFSFSKADSDIVLPPQHIRIGNKDYILVAEASGKLNILSRVGKIRVPLSYKMNFSELPIEKEGSNFVVITTDKRKVSIDQKGAVNPQSLDVSDTYWFSIHGTTKLTLDDNLMRINGKLTELPVGFYSKPQLLPFGKNLYATITETKENAVYVYSKNGQLLPHFPIYGTSEIDLADANRNNAMNIVVRGEKNEVLLYQLPK